MNKTTRDEISLDLDGTIDAAIKKLTKLKKEYPGGRIHLTSDYEYGESYPRLKLEFTRPKEPIELELEKWQEKRRRYESLSAAAAAYRHEGDEYPRANELAKLTDELGCFAEGGVWLQIWDNKTIVSWDPMRGARTREGKWVARTMMADQYDKMLEEVAAQGTEARSAET